MKYAEWIRILENEVIYAASSIVRHGEEHGLSETEKLQPRDRIRIRNALNCFAGSHFSGGPDGVAQKEGKITLMGWYGWRWKRALPAHYFQDQELKDLRHLEADFGNREAKPENPTGNTRPSKWLRLPAFLSRKKPAVLIFALALGMFSLGTLVSVYSDGLRVLNEEGPRAALEYFRSAAFDRKDYKAEFGQAWAKYEIGDFADAENDCYRLLTYRDLPDPLRGNCYYLLGYLQMPTNRLGEAKESFRRAADIYEKHRKWQNLYKSSLAMGKIALEQGYLDEAEAIFHEAFTMNRPIDRNLDYYYYLQAKLAFLREDYVRALQLARKGLFESEKDGKVNAQANSLCEIGFYLMLVGNYQAGYETTMEAQELIQKIGDQRKYYFNLVNLILLSKCRGEPLRPLLKQVEGRIEEEGPGQLEDHLEFVLDWDCVPEIESDNHFGGTPETGGEDQPPPPDQQ